MEEYSPDNEPVRVHRSTGPLDALHALLGAMPVAYFLLAFLIDITYVRTAYFIWPFFSIWLITAGLVAGGLAVLLGLIEWLVRRREISRQGLRWHGIVTIVALILGLFNAFIHSRDGWTSVVPEGIILSGLTTLLMIIAAFLGASSRRAS
jgi:uncharacterized membrane protein